MNHSNAWRADAAIWVLLALPIVVLFFSALPDGDFWWSDSPRHALNGAFVKDLFADLPLRNPREYAIAYYLQYPALTILFYPPLFPAIEALFFAALGVSHASAQIAVACMFWFAVVASYRIARIWLPLWSAIGVALLFASAPEIAFWGRQVMLEIPTYCFLLWSVYLFLRYVDRLAPRYLYGAIIMFAMALYTKQSVIFMIPAFGIALVLRRGAGLLRDRAIWIGAASLAVALVPLAVLTIKFGQANVQSVAGITDSDVSRLSLDGWLWYARRLPDQIGWIPLVLGAGYAIGCQLDRRWRLPSPHQAFLLAWFGIGYLFFSAIDLKEARHSIFILYPLLLMSVLFLARVLPRRLAQFASLLLAAGTMASTLAWHPAPSVTGYRAAADYIARHAPPGSAVLFSGLRDGSFIFNMRTQEERRDLSVIRADKLLLRVSVRRELGVRNQDVSESGLREMLNNYGVHYVVSQPDFWADLSNMQMLTRLLGSAAYQEVASFRIVSNFPHNDREIKIYRNLGPVKSGGQKLRIPLDVIGITIQGSLKQGGDQPPPAPQQ